MYDGKYAVLISVQVAQAPTCSTWPTGCAPCCRQIQAQLPHGLQADVAYDASKYIKQLDPEVESTLLHRS